MPFMRSLVALSAAVALVCCYSSTADAACDAICSSTTVYGFTAGGASNCLCGDSGSTTSCNCGGQCYTKQLDGRIFLFGYGADGKCLWDAPDCGNCDASGSTSDSAIKTPSPSTASPTSNSSSGTGTGTGTNSAGSSAGSNNSKTPTAGSDTSSSSSQGMQTWQIALIICCAVLVFIVAVVALLSCYCKARRRLVESEDQEEDSTYYHQQPYSGVNGAGFMVASTSSNNLSGGSGGGGVDAYDSRRQSYNVKAPPGSYVSNDGRYMMAVNSNGSTSVGSADSPDRGAAYTRPSSGSVGEMATTPYASHDRGRGSSMHSQAVTL